MGCQSEVDIGDYLTFSVCTHDPDTGVLTDADAVPTYRIYEDETGAAILNGNMAKLDDASTTGFYTERVECSAANGFEDGKSYTVYIEATVDSDTGGICYGFRAMTPVWSASSRTLTSAAAAAASSVASSMAATAQDWSMHKGDSKDITVTVYDGDGATVTLTGATIVWGMATDYDETAIVTKTTAAADITISGSDFSFSLDPTDTSGLAAGQYYHEAQVTDSGGDVATVMTGVITLVEELI